MPGLRNVNAPWVSGNRQAGRHSLAPFPGVVPAPGCRFARNDGYISLNIGVK